MNPAQSSRALLRMQQYLPFGVLGPGVPERSLFVTGASPRLVSPKSPCLTHAVMSAFQVDRLGRPAARGTQDAGPWSLLVLRLVRRRDFRPCLQHSVCLLRRYNACVYRIYVCTKYVCMQGTQACQVGIPTIRYGLRVSYASEQFDAILNPQQIRQLTLALALAHLSFSFASFKTSSC
jgi:hypothetical protein